MRSIEDGEQAAGLLTNDESFDIEESLKYGSSKTTSISPLSLSHSARQCSNFILQVLIFLLPSYLQPRNKEKTRVKHLSAVPDTLDHITGLRGVASVIVLLYHLGHGPYRSSMDHVYGSAPAHANNHILQLPFLRTFYAAEASVALFFVLSGYALTRRSVAATAKGDTARANALLSSLAFRRLMRLFGPALAASFLAFCMQRAGWMPMRGLPEGYTSTVASDSWMYLRYLGSLCDIWTWQIDMESGNWWFNPHLWTVPVEFRCSMVVLLLSFSTQNCRGEFRALIDVALIVQAFWAGRWDVAPFIAGKAIAELQFSFNRLPSWQRQSRIIFRILVLTILFVGIYLASYPAEPPKDGTFFVQMANWVHHSPEGRRIYYAVASILICSCIILEPILQRLFATPALRYLGSISYSLYLTHGILIRVVGGRIMNLAWRQIGTQGWQFNVAFALGSALLLPLVFWVADVFERAVEAPCIRLSKWIETTSQVT